MTENRLSHVAIRFVKYTYASRDYAVFELGRVSDIELQELEKAYPRPLSTIYGDPTKGTLQKSEGDAHLYTVRLCLYIGIIREGKDLIEEACDNSNVTISYTSTNVRPTLKSIERGPRSSRTSWFERYPVDWDQCVKEEESEEEEIETSTSTVFEVLAVAVCNRGSSCLQIARMDGNERRRFDDFAGEYGSELNGQFDKLVTDKSVWHEHDRVLKNVSFADDLVEFKPGESICLSYIKIERTGNEFKVVEARRHADDDVRERWHLAPAKQPKGPLKKKFMDVAVRNVKKASHYDYYILEIGRLTQGELSDLKEIFRYTTHANDDIVTDETKGEVVSKEVPIPSPTGENLSGYHTAKICVYWPGCPLKVGTSDDAVAITLESKDGNYRPMVKDINSMNDVVNELSKNWFERFPFEARDDASHLDIPEEGFSSVALKIEEMLGGDWWRVKIGRLSEDEAEKLRRLHAYVKPKSCPPYGDKTEGELHIEKRKGTEFYEAEVCLRIRIYNPETGINHLNSGMIFDNTNFTLIWSSELTSTWKNGTKLPLEPRLILKNFRNNPDGALLRLNNKDWFEARDDTPIKIRLNNVAVVTVTYNRDCTADIVFSLAHCCNYSQAVDEISEALTVREGEPGRGISWNPTTKILKITIRNGLIDDISNITDMHTRLWMCEFQYDPDNGSWGVNMMHKMGGYAYFCPTRRSGKTAELKRQLNAAYGLHSIWLRYPEGYMDTDIAGDAMRYCMHDVAIQESMWRRAQKFTQEMKSEEEETMRFGVPKIKQLIFDDPTTVVIWEDGTKTIVHARDEKFDPEKGLAMAIARKALGNGREYYTYMQRQIKKGLRDSEGRKKKNEAKPAKKPKTAPKKKGGTKK